MRVNFVVPVKGATSIIRVPDQELNQIRAYRLQAGERMRLPQKLHFQPPRRGIGDFEDAEVVNITVRFIKLELSVEVVVQSVS